MGGADVKKPCPACGCCCGGTKGATSSKGEEEHSTENIYEDLMDLTGYDSGQDPVHDPNNWWKDEIVASDPEEEDANAGDDGDDEKDPDDETEDAGDDGDDKKGGDGKSDEKGKGIDVLDDEEEAEEANVDLDSAVDGLARFGIQLCDLERIEEEDEEEEEEEEQEEEEENDDNEEGGGEKEDKGVGASVVQEVLKSWITKY